MNNEDFPLHNLFSGEPQQDLFPRLIEMFPTREMKPEAPRPFPTSNLISLPTQFEIDGAIESVEEFLVSTDTVALLVIRDGAIVFEEYYLTGGRDVNWISFSVAKSFISVLLGIALDEGLIESVIDPIDRYVTSLKGSIYEGVKIKDLLQMSSGARWLEDYSNPDSDINRLLIAILSAGGSLEDSSRGMSIATEPGTVCQYNSVNSQVLGMLIAAATGRSITDFMQERLFTPLGMENPGYWFLDSHGMEMAFGGLSLTARDFAKIGELYRNKGTWHGTRIVSPDWVSASLTPSAEHLKPGRVLLGGKVFPLGYGYQWWIPEGNRGEFSAIGVYNQFVFVDPTGELTIVKLSANRAYGTSSDEETNQEMKTIAFMRTVAAKIDSG